MNNIEKALRIKLRFKSVKGLINTEQVLQLGLRSSNDYDLQTVTSVVYNAIQATAKVDFVNIKETPEDLNILRLEILKSAITERHRIIAEFDNKATNKSQVAEYNQLITEKQLEAKKDLSLDELIKLRDELDSKS